MTRTRIALLIATAVAAAGSGAFVQLVQSTSAPGTGAQPVARGPAQFQPGVCIDWPGRAVRVATHVVLRRGPLEFLACFSGKEHESIVRFEAAAEHVYVALGLIGLEPGHPPVWDPGTTNCRPPTGDLIDITLEWEGDGKPRVAGAYDWLREVEYARTPPARPWVFAGSVRLEDETLAAGHSGVGVALVDFPDSLIALSCRHSSRNAELWVEANADVVPPIGTPVQLVLRPATARQYRIVMSALGELRVDGRYVAWADLADLLALNRRLDEAIVPTIRVEGALESDVRLLRAELESSGLSPDALRFTVDERPR